MVYGYVVGEWQLCHIGANKGWYQTKTNQMVHQRRQQKKGAGAEDAHKLLVRHNVDFCATCCSRCFWASKFLPTPSEHHPGEWQLCHIGANKGWYQTKTNQMVHQRRQQKKGAGAEDAHKLIIILHMRLHLQCAEPQVSRSNLTKYCACHAERLTYLIIITYETSFTMRGATAVTIQPHQILRLSRRKTRILSPHHI